MKVSGTSFLSFLLPSSFGRRKKIFYIGTHNHLNCALILFKHTFQKVFLLHCQSKKCMDVWQVYLLFFCDLLFTCIVKILCSNMTLDELLYLQTTHNLRPFLFLTVYHQSPVDSTPRPDLWFQLRDTGHHIKDVRS